MISFNYTGRRTLRDNLLLSSLMSFTAGAINVLSFLIFFAFTTNVTGYYTILAAEIIKGNFYQVAVVLAWIVLFFLGSFTSNLILINLGRKNANLASALPLLIEMLCLTIVGLYGQFFYEETLSETEILLCVLVYAMGIQNGFTASLTNFTVKTTHLTGTTTDLSILFSLFTKRHYRSNPELKGRAKLMLFIIGFYMTGAFVSGMAYELLGFRLFYLICFVLLTVLLYEHFRIQALKQDPVLKNEAITKQEMAKTGIGSKTPVL